MMNKEGYKIKMKVKVYMREYLKRNKVNKNNK